MVSLQHLCAYDDGAVLWHDLAKEEYRVIAPTETRLKKVTLPVLRRVLRAQNRSVTGQKSELVARCLKPLQPLHPPASTVVVVTAAPNQSTVNAVVVTTTTTAQPHDTTTAQPHDYDVVDFSKIDTMLTHRCKFGQTHNERRTHKRKSKSDNEQQPKCWRLTNTTMPAGRNLTATETCTGINLQAHALYSLAARGEGATFAERDEYNLLKYKHSDLTAWGSRYDWKPGCNVSHLPVAITSVRKVDDWICVNVFADGTVVFKRLSPPLYCRGSRAAPRHTKFVWTPVMSQWFANRTHGLHKKSIQFVEMSEEAHDRWGHLAPDQEHMENRIKSRDQARKEGRRVAWDTPKPGVSVRL